MPILLLLHMDHKQSTAEIEEKKLWIELPDHDHFLSTKDQLTRHMKDYVKIKSQIETSMHQVISLQQCAGVAAHVQPFLSPSLCASVDTSCDALLICGHWVQPS